MKYRLMVIEGDASDLSLSAVSALGREGFAVDIYTSYLHAWSVVSITKPDLIVLGEGLKIDGFEACRQLRQIVDIPILILGSNHSAEGWELAVEAGADAYLSKPFHYVELIARVKSILRRREWTLS